MTGAGTQRAHDPSCPKAHKETRGLNWPAFRCTCGVDPEPSQPAGVQRTHALDCARMSGGPNALLAKCTCGIGDDTVTWTPRQPKYYVSSQDSDPPHDPDCPAFKNPRNVCVCKTPEEERGIRMVRKTGWLPELLREANKTARDVETLARGDLVRMWIPYAADEFWMVMDTPGDDKIVELQRLGDINAPMLRVPLSLLATTDVYLKANRK
jgi:hypothetical protein